MRDARPGPGRRLVARFADLVTRSRSAVWPRLKLVALLLLGAGLAFAVPSGLSLELVPLALVIMIAVPCLLVACAIWVLLLLPRVHAGWSAFAAAVAYLGIGGAFDCLSGWPALAWPVFMLWDAVC